MPSQGCYRGEPGTGQDAGPARAHSGKDERVSTEASAALCSPTLSGKTPKKPAEPTWRAGAWAGKGVFKLIPYTPMLFVSCVSVIQFKSNDETLQ